MKPKTVLLLDAETVQAASIARAFHNIRWRVIGILSQKISPGNFSHYIDEKIYIKHAYSSKKYKKCLFDLLNNKKPDLIVPLYTDGALFLSQTKTEIEEIYDIPCAIESEKNFSLANNKSMLMEFCREHNIPHPKTTTLSAQCNLEEASDYVGFPALIKPDFSSGSKGIIRVENLLELRKIAWNHIKQYGPCSLQEYIETPGFYFTTMLYRDFLGNVNNSCTLKVLRCFPVQGGTSCYAQCVNHPAIEAMCRNLLNLLNWHGFANFDILQDKYGNYKIIEMNPRVPSSIHGAYISGINFAEIIASDQLNLPAKTYSPSYGKYLRYLGLDIMWFFFSPNRWKLKPSWFNFFDNNIFLQDGGIHDPFVALGGILSGLVKYFNPQFRKSKLRKKV